MSPGDGYVRLQTQDNGGIPDGYHTGGVWYHPQRPNYIWKPLDGIVNVAPNPYHAPTGEVDNLDEIVKLGLPSFPKNYERVDQNGRSWIVRRRATVLGPNYGQTPTKEQALAIERDLRTLNGHLWTINDYLCVAIDPDTNLPFVLDMSVAGLNSPATRHLCSDEHYYMHWIEQCGLANIYNLRKTGAKIMIGRDGIYHKMIMAGHKEYIVLYGTEREITTLPHDLLPYARILHRDDVDGLCTFFLAKEPIPDFLQKSYDLIFMWQPWPEPKEVTGGR